METTGQITNLTTFRERDIEVLGTDGQKYLVRVPFWQLQEGKFQVGDTIKIRIVDSDQFAYYLY